jgi:sugar phosphate isomerase/epimerase
MHLGRQSRRAVLAAGASGVVAGVMTGRRALAQTEPDEKPQSFGDTPKGEPLPSVVKVSVAGYSFREDLDKPGKPGKMSLFDLTDMAARWRIDAIEPTSYYFLKDDDEWVVALKRKVFLNGLEISGTPVGNNFCLPPGPELTEQINLVKKWVDICVKLGSPAIRVFAGQSDKGRSREQIFRTLVDAMKEAAEYAGSRGIFLGVENHGFMTETADDVLRIVDAVKHDWLRINLDSGNFKKDTYKQFAKLAPLAVICQFKVQAYSPEGKQEPGDFDKLVRILREANYRGYVALEYEGKDPHEQVPVLLKKIQAAVRG